MKFLHWFQQFIVWALIVSVNTAFSEIGSISCQIQSVSFSSNSYHGNKTSYQLAENRIFSISGATWLQLHFTDTHFGDGSYLEIISVADSGIQKIGTRTLNDWHNSSAFFNGDSLIFNLFVSPYDSNVRFNIDTVATGASQGEGCDLGYGDTKLTPLEDPRVARVFSNPVLSSDILVNWATAFIVQGGSLVTAQHVYVDLGPNIIAEFNVPRTHSDGIPLHPPPIDQYVIKDHRKSSNSAEGNDWCVFTTERSPRLRQGTGFQVIEYASPLPDSVTVTGYGCTGIINPDPLTYDPSLKGYQRTSKGAFEGYSQSMISYTAYTEPGVSGGPVVLKSDNTKAIGVHNKTATATEHNRGTGFNRSGFFDAAYPSVISVDQVASVNTMAMVFDDENPTVGNIWRTDNGVGGWVMETPPYNYLGIPGSGVTFLSDTAEYYHHLTARYFKFHDWADTGTTRIIYHRVEEAPAGYVSHFINTKFNITIKNEVIDAPLSNGGTIGFKDPWFLDTTAFTSSYKVKCSRGMNAIFRQRNSPFRPDLSIRFDGTFYRGVFLNQIPDIDNPSKPYYSVRAESTQIIGGFECVFDHWEATDADLFPIGDVTGYNQRAIVFTSDSAVVKAMYRMVQVSTQMSLSNGWNMVSVPSRLLEDSTDEVFPDAISQAFTFSPPGGYLGRNPLKLGEGYWLKYPQSMNPTIIGGKLVLDTIQLQAGWNMIGSLSSPMPVTSISLSEGTQLLSAFLGFAPGQGYVPATHINPGKGYWIKVAQNATMIMDVSAEQNMYTTTSLEEITSSPEPPAFPPGASLIAPVNGAENVTLPCTLRWSPTLSFPADSSRVYWSTDDFLGDTHNSGKLTDTFYIATTLTTGTTYYWKVKIYHPVEGVLWSEVNTFTTGGIPAIPILISPENNTDSLTQPLTFTWNAVNGATSYHIQIGMGGYDPPSINKYVAGTSYTDSTLLGMNSYIWHVSAVNGFGEGDFSEDWTFSTRRLSLSVQSVQDGSVYHPKLSWTAEGNSAGATQYKLYRYDCAYGAGDCGATPTLITTTTARIYTDTYPMIMQGQTPNRTYWYYVKKGSTSNKVSWDGRIDAKVGIPQEETPNRITLYDAYPNPFNPVTTIYYTLPEEMPVKLVVSDVLGREIATLVDGIESAGYKTVSFDASSAAGGLPSGIYFYRLTAGSFTDMKKMILAR